MSSELIASAFGYAAGYYSPSMGSAVASSISTFTISLNARFIEKSPSHLDKSMVKIVGFSLADSLNTGACALSAYLLKKTFSELVANRVQAGFLAGVAAVAVMSSSCLVSTFARNFLKGCYTNPNK